jgi:Ribbon-helix-helix protein, copG family
MPARQKRRQRSERLQVELSPDEIAAVDEFRYRARMPSRAAAVRELLRRALVSVGEGRLTTLNEQGELPVLEWIAVSGSDYCDAVRRRDEVP